MTETTRGGGCKAAADTGNSIASAWAVTPDTARRFARYFGTTAQFWRNLQSAHDLKLTEAGLGKKIVQEVRPLEIAT